MSQVKISHHVIRIFFAAITVDHETSWFLDALSHPHWRRAMHSEIDGLEHNKTWYLTTLPPRKKSLGCKWVFKIKRKSDGSIERYRARLRNNSAKRII